MTRPRYRDLKPGCPVRVIAGKHRGQTAVFVRIYTNGRNGGTYPVVRFGDGSTARVLLDSLEVD